MTTEYCKARITALALPICISSSSSYLPSLENATFKILELLYLFRWCSTHLQWTLIRVFQKMKYLSLVMQIFIPVLSHAAAKSFNVRWRPHSVEESKNKSSANSRRHNFAVFSRSKLIGLAALVDLIHANMKKKGEKTHPCLRSTATWNGFFAYHWHEHRFSAADYQCHTPAKPSKVYLANLGYSELGHMLFRDQ